MTGVKRIEKNCALGSSKNFFVLNDVMLNTEIEYLCIYIYIEQRMMDRGNTV